MKKYVRVSIMLCLLMLASPNYIVSATSAVVAVNARGSYVACALGDEKIPPQPIAHTDFDGFVQVEDVYTLTVITVGSGTVSRNNTGPNYQYGDAVLLTAVPAAGWSFQKWTWDLSGSANPATLVMTHSMMVIAWFTQDQYALTVSVVGGGSVSKSPDQATYTWGTNVTLTASASVGWTFAGWSGDASGTANPTIVNMTGNMSVNATFTQNVYTLSVNVFGSGSVTLNNTGPNYHYGDAVLLTGVPSAGWSFQGWSGNLTGSTNPATLVIAGNMSVAATFTQDQYTLTVTVVGGGSVSESPDQATYTWGTNVTLTASASVGWTFAGWSGDASGTANPIAVNVTGNMSVTATFTQDQYTLAVTVVGSGSVSRNNIGPNYHYGDAVQLTAVPDTGWIFQYWSGDLSGSVNPATLVMTGNLSVTAYLARACDVAVTNIASNKTVIGQNYAGNISVTVENYGGFPETFNVTIRANTIDIKTILITLDSGNSTTIVLVWDTTGFALGNYTLSAYAWPLTGEANTSNNNFTDGVVYVGIPGDVDRSRRVDMIDMWLIQGKFGGIIGDPRYVPNYDIDNNGKIDMIDLWIAQKHFGQMNP